MPTHSPALRPGGTFLLKQHLANCSKTSCGPDRASGSTASAGRHRQKTNYLMPVKAGTARNTIGRERTGRQILLRRRGFAATSHTKVWQICVARGPAQCPARRATAGKEVAAS